MSMTNLTQAMLVNTGAIFGRDELRSAQVKAVQQAAEILNKIIQKSDEDYPNAISSYSIFDDFYASDNILFRATDIELYITIVMSQTQMEFGCLYPALIYMDRLREKSNGSLQISKSNWRSMIATCLMLSSKVWDDNSMVNGDFQYVYPAPSDVQRVNALERLALHVLSYDIGVTLFEYLSYEDGTIYSPSVEITTKPRSMESCRGFRPQKRKEVSCGSVRSVSSCSSADDDNDTCPNSLDNSTDVDSLDSGFPVASVRAKPVASSTNTESLATRYRHKRSRHNALMTKSNDSRDDKGVKSTTQLLFRAAGGVLRKCLSFPTSSSSFVSISSRSSGAKYNKKTCGCGGSRIHCM
jgi:hypothetical protein